MATLNAFQLVADQMRSLTSCHLRGTVWIHILLWASLKLAYGKYKLVSFRSQGEREAGASIRNNTVYAGVFITNPDSALL